MSTTRNKALKKCSVEGCGSFAYAKRFCRLHYARWKAHGDPLKTLSVSKNGDRRGTYQHKRGAETPTYKGPVTTVCAVQDCGNTTTTHTNIYCWKHYSRLLKTGSLVSKLEAQRAAEGLIPTGACHYCGEKIPGTHNKIYCSDRCYTRAKRNNPKTAKCERCGAEFHPFHKAKFCSVKCREDHIEERNAKYFRERWLNESEYDLSDLWKSGNRKRAALLKAATVEQFSRTEIFERDGWSCGICGHPIDKALRWPNPLSASLDHIQALSAGGQHSRMNVQAAHLRCNLTKNKYRDTAKIRRLQHKIAERIVALADVGDAKADRLAARHDLMKKRMEIE